MKQLLKLSLAMLLACVLSLGSLTAAFAEAPAEQEPPAAAGGSCSAGASAKAAVSEPSDSTQANSIARDSFNSCFTKIPPYDRSLSPV